MGRAGLPWQGSSETDSSKPGVVHLGHPTRTSEALVPAHPETSLLESQFETLPLVCLAFTLVEDLDASHRVRALCAAVLEVHEKAERALQGAVRWSESRSRLQD